MTHCPPQTAVFTDRTFRLRLRFRPSKDSFREVVSGVFELAFLFFVGTTIVVSLDGQQDVQFLFQKCTSREELNRDVRALNISFERAGYP